MVEFAFYRDVYGGDSVPEGEFRSYARDASAQLDRYKRIYAVTATGSMHCTISTGREAAGRLPA